jgi:ribosomal protein S6E (S10)
MNIVADKILELLREQLSDSRNIERFYLGNPTELSAADLPAIFVQPVRKSVEQLDNVNDVVTGEFIIGVCVDPAKYQRVDMNEGTAERFLMEIEGGRNSDGTPITNSVMYVMRNKFTLEGKVAYQEQETIWGEREMTGGVAKEIHIYISLKFKVKNTT